MKIVMLGAPGAGKGTQAKMIAAKYGIPHISTGDIFRANIKNGTELGEKAKQYMDQGLLVPDELTLALIMDRFAQADCSNGYVLDGFPRTIAQAEALTASLKANNDALDMAIDVDVPDENIIERMGGRRACVACGGTFHVLYNPPRIAGKCDLCGAQMKRMSDWKAVNQSFTALFFCVSCERLVNAAFRFKEYYDRSCWLGMDIDAGPVIINLSSSGTAFAIGPATYFNDTKVRKGLLRTAEIAGTTVTRFGKSHYLLANIALVGEAILLAMRTTTKWV